MLKNLFIGQWARNGGSVCIMLAAAMFAGTAVAQQKHIVGGGQVINSQFLGIPMAPSDTVRVNAGTFVNGVADLDNREIAKVSVYGGNAQNERGSTVTGSVEVRGGVFTNMGGATVGDFSLSSGDFSNRGMITGGGIVSGGTFRNNAGASVKSMTLNQTEIDSTVHNSGTISDVTVNAGTFNNLSGSKITDLKMVGGTVNNEGLITEMRYSGGAYHNQGGSIGALTIAGKANGTNFGKVDSLSFDTENGSGYLTINGIVNGDGGLSFNSNMTVGESVNFDGANLMLDFSGALTGNYANFDAWTSDFVSTFDNGLGTWDVSWGSLFGIDDGLVSNWDLINTINVGWGNDQWATIWDDGRAINQMWSVSELGISGNAVPEPATLAVLALGLAGLGLARRRQIMHSKV